MIDDPKSETPNPGSPEDDRKERAADQQWTGGVSSTKPVEGGDEAPEGDAGSPRG